MAQLVENQVAWEKYENYSKNLEIEAVEDEIDTELFTDIPKLAKFKKRLDKIQESIKNDDECWKVVDNVNEEVNLNTVDSHIVRCCTMSEDGQFQLLGCDMARVFIQ